MTATTTVSRRIPPQRLVNLINPLVRAVSESPLHTALDNTLVVLHIRGRKTGRHYDIPVGYLALDGKMIVVTQHRWRANLRGISDIDVTYRGHRQRMHVHLDEDPTTVAITLHRVIDQLGPKAAERQFGLRADHTPDLPDLTAAVSQYHLASLTLKSETALSETAPG